MSMIGLAARPRTDVLPTCSTSAPRSATASRTGRAISAEERRPVLVVIRHDNRRARGGRLGDNFSDSLFGGEIRRVEPDADARRPTDEAVVELLDRPGAVAFVLACCVACSDGF